MKQRLTIASVIILVSVVIFWACNKESLPTIQDLPSGITTTEITDTTATTATSGGTIIDDGGFTITSRGVCWSKSSEPTISDVHTFDGSGTGSFTSILTGLLPNTSYYIRAYATNLNGTVYGNQLSFTTDDGIPVLTTTEINDITATTATSGGTITDDGGLEITVRGVCWSTTANPTITDSHTTDGTGTGTFTSNLTGLNATTTYYLRSYATNIIGTVYGNEISFTSDRPDITGQTGNLMDIDGNYYNWIGIGKQAWMVENLKTKHYSNGTTIQLIEIATSWHTMTISDKAYCYYDNSSTNADAYGALYTWAAAMNGATSSNANPSGVQGACPDGWHVPSDVEWTELFDYLGGTNIAGGKMKETGNTHWIIPNTGATNESGFTGLPSGNRENDGDFRFLNSRAYFWSATEQGSSYAGYSQLSYDHSDVGLGALTKTYGFSVRCVKD